MTDMEYRAYITINDFPHWDDEDAWLPFMKVLERESSDLGAVLSWDSPTTANVVISADVSNRSHLADTAATRIGEALRAAGLGDLYPAAIEIEPVTDEQPVPA